MALTYIPVASNMHDRQALAGMLEESERALAALGLRRADAAMADAEGAEFTFIQTGGVEADVVRRHRCRMQQGRGGPVLLIAHPAHSALAASLEVLAQVRQEGGDGRIYLLRGGDDSSTLAEIAQTVRCLEANRRLAEDRIGLVGASSDWLVASSQRPEIVAARFGMKLLPLGLDELRAHMARDSAPSAGPEYAVWEKATGRDGVTKESFAGAVGVYRGLKELVRIHRLSGVSVRCFDLVVQDKITGCLALSRLADEGIAAGCEGDVPSVILLRWLWHLTGQAGWMANPSDLEPRTGRVLLAHCTVPLGLVTEHRLTTHFESGLGVGIDGTLPPGPVTLLRLGGAGLDRWWGAEGEALESLHGEGLCRTQIRVGVEPSAATELLRRPLGNHVVLVRGHVKRLFQEAFDLQAGVCSQLQEKS